MPATRSPHAPMPVRILMLPDGRIAEAGVAGDPRGHALVLHHGTPGDATTFADWQAACVARGLRLVCISRPGYGGSARRPQRNARCWNPHTHSGARLSQAPKLAPDLLPLRHCLHLR